MGLYERAVQVSALVQETTAKFRKAADGVAAPDYDPASVGEATEMLMVLEDTVRLLEGVEVAAVTALDRVTSHNMLMGGFAGESVQERVPETEPKRYEDELVKREWFLLTFHESGHAEWALHSSFYRVERMGGLYVSEPTWRRPPMGSGWTSFTEVPSLGKLLNPRKPPSARELFDSAVGSLAGPAAEAYWLNYMEREDYRKSLDHVYNTGGRSDFAHAWSAVDGSMRKIRRAERVAKELVADSWDGLVLMAEEARDKEELNAKEMAEYA